MTNNYKCSKTPKRCSSGCLEYWSGKCVKYTGPYLPNIGINSGVDIDQALEAINNVIGQGGGNQNLQQVLTVGNTATKAMQLQESVLADFTAMSAANTGLNFGFVNTDPGNLPGQGFIMAGKLGAGSDPINGGVIQLIGSAGVLAQVEDGPVAFVAGTAAGSTNFNAGVLELVGTKRALVVRRDPVTFSPTGGVEFPQTGGASISGNNADLSDQSIIYLSVDGIPNMCLLSRAVNIGLSSSSVEAQLHVAGPQSGDPNTLAGWFEGRVRGVNAVNPDEYVTLQQLNSLPGQVNADWNAVSGPAQILNKPVLATVATSGDYNDLSNLPTIPAAQVNSDWNATTGVAQILNKPNVILNQTTQQPSSNAYLSGYFAATAARFGGGFSIGDYALSVGSLPSSLNVAANFDGKVQGFDAEFSNEFVTKGQLDAQTLYTADGALTSDRIVTGDANLLRFMFTGLETLWATSTGFVTTANGAGISGHLTVAESTTTFGTGDGFAPTNYIQTNNFGVDIYVGGFPKMNISSTNINLADYPDTVGDKVLATDNTGTVILKTITAPIFPIINSTSIVSTSITTAYMNTNYSTLAIGNRVYFTNLSDDANKVIVVTKLTASTYSSNADTKLV